jgi:hypothetical protein
MGAATSPVSGRTDPWPSETPTRRRRPIIAVAAAAIVVFGGAIGTIIWTTTNGGGGKTSAISTPPDLLTTTPVDAHRQALLNWRDAHLSTITVLAPDVQQAADAATAPDTGAARGACSKLGHDVAVALATQQPPDATIAARQRSALWSYKAASDDCLSGNYNRATQEFTQGNTQLEQESLALGALNLNGS